MSVIEVGISPKSLIKIYRGQHTLSSLNTLALVPPSHAPTHATHVLILVCARSDLNALVANYLCTEGFLSAAENFAREAELEGLELESVGQRMEIRRAVQRGEVVHGTRLVNELDPEVSLDAFSSCVCSGRRGGKEGRMVMIKLYYAPLSERARGCNDLEQTSVMI